MRLLQSLVRFGMLLFGSIGTGWAADHMVTANPDLTFSPANLTINAGDTVTFTNAGGFHNVVTSNGSGSFRCAAGCDGHGGNGAPSGSSWSATVPFNTAGSFEFHCEIHVSDGMVGAITVNAAPPPSTTIGGYISGNWYDPSESGHGFQIEVTNSGNAMDAIWFVYAPDGNVGASGTGGQNWIYSQGTWDPTSNAVTLPAFILNGAKFPFPAAQFNSSDVKNTSWGTLTFTFTDCNNGTVSWNSTIPAYGSGTLPIQRLTQIAGTTCPAQ
jgi:plastocyanin